MASILTILLITVLGFVTTNLDNLVLMLGFLGRKGAKKRAIVLGYLGAMGLIILSGWGVAELVDLLPEIRWGWLGLVPISIGLLELMRLDWTGNGKGRVAVPPESESHEDERLNTKSCNLGALGVFLIMLANGSDTFGVFLALYLESNDRLGIDIASFGLACAAIWCGFALWLSGHEAFSKRLLPLATWILPFLLIGIGFYILLDTLTD
ncbi:MAG: cadmium resistance transporter [Planctomycetota bacterium]|nr:cadmium resistance transporter [Planctomycetota bacterium]